MVDKDSIEYTQYKLRITKLDVNNSVIAVKWTRCSELIKFHSQSKKYATKDVINELNREVPNTWTFWQTKDDKFKDTRQSKIIKYLQY